MTAKKRGLGKGLDALLGAGSDTSSISSNQSNMLRILAIDLIERSKFQPRQNFNKDALNSLAESIKTQGLVQPILVRPSGSENSYEIVASIKDSRVLLYRNKETSVCVACRKCYCVHFRRKS